MNRLLTTLTIGILMISCSDTNPGIAPLQKNHSVEVTFETKQMSDSAVLLFTKQNVYLKGKLVKTILRTDTLPAPGDTIQTVETDNSQQTVRVPKEYEFFVTVK